MSDEPRFVVRHVTGAFIDPARSSEGRGSRSPLPTSYYVHDSAYCYRVVASFDAPRQNDGPAGEIARRRLAEICADELNRRDRENDLRPWPRPTMLEAEA